MRKYVTDREGHSIYLTDERWRHIVDYHPEMEECRDRTLDVLKKGRRRQDPLDSGKFKYSARYDDIAPNNTVVVVVKFGIGDDEQPNNFVLTAYQVYDH